MNMRVDGPGGIQSINQLREYWGELPVQPLSRVLGFQAVPDSIEACPKKVAPATPKPIHQLDEDVQTSAAGVKGVVEDVVDTVVGWLTGESDTDVATDPRASERSDDGRYAFGLRPEIAHPSGAARRDAHRLLNRMAQANDQHTELTWEEITEQARHTDLRMQQNDERLSELMNRLDAYPDPEEIDDLDAAKEELRQIVRETDALVREQTHELINFDKVMADAYRHQGGINEEGARAELEGLKEASRRQQALLKERLAKLDDIIKKKNESWWAKGFDLGLSLLGITVGAAAAITTAVASGAIAPVAVLAVAVTLTVGLSIDQFFNDAGKKKIAKLLGGDSKAEQNTWLSRLQMAASAAMIISALGLGAWTQGASMLSGAVNACQALSKVGVGVTEWRQGQSKAYFTKLEQKIRDAAEERERRTQGIGQLHGQQMSDLGSARKAAEMQLETVTGFFK